MKSLLLSKKAARELSLIPVCILHIFCCCFCRWYSLFFAIMGWHLTSLTSRESRIAYEFNTESAHTMTHISAVWEVYEWYEYVLVQQLLILFHTIANQFYGTSNIYAWNLSACIYTCRLNQTIHFRQIELLY